MSTESGARRDKTIATIIVVAGIVLLGILGWQARKFTVDASADTLLMKDNRDYLLTQLADQKFSPDEFILIAYKPQDETLFSGDVLERVVEMSGALENIERVAAVRSITNVPFFGTVEDIGTGLDPAELTWEKKRFSAQSMKNILTNHPLYEGLLVNAEQTALAMQVVFAAQPELESLNKEILEIRRHLLERELTDDENAALNVLQEKKRRIDAELNAIRSEEIKQIRQVLEPWNSTGEFYLGGNNLLADQLINIIRSDLVMFGAIIAGLVIFVLYFLFRRIRWVILPLACCSASVLATLGILGWLELRVTVISTNVIALQIILTLAVIIHLIVQYQEIAGRDDVPTQADAVKEMVRRKLKPSCYAGLTTAIGFGSLIFSGVAPVISFGWMMVMAIIVTLVVSLILFPALLLLLFSREQDRKSHAWLDGLMRKGAALAEEQSAAILLVAVAVTAVFIAGCLRLSAENSFINYFSDSTDVFRELSFIDREFGGSTPFDVLYTVPAAERQDDLVLTAQAMQSVSKIQSQLEKHEAIGNITSVADFARIAATAGGKPLTEYELTVLYQTLDADVRGDLFGGYFSEAAQQVRISTRIQDTTTGLNRAQLLRDIEQDLADLGIAKEHYEFTNLFVLYQDILSRLVKSQWLTLAIVYAVMTLALMVLFGSVKIALIALVPNVITTVAILGTMGWAGIHLDLMTMTIAAVATGISVDDTIHYVHRYLDEKRLRQNRLIERTHLSVGYAMVYTSVVIMIGFGALAFSDFMPSVYFGILTAITMLIALAADMVVLPALLKRFSPAQRQSSASPGAAAAAASP